MNKVVGRGIFFLLSLIQPIVLADNEKRFIDQVLEHKQRVEQLLTGGKDISSLVKKIDQELTVLSQEELGLKKSIQSLNDELFEVQSELSQVDKKLLKELNAVYNILHLSGYYDGNNKYNVIREGLDSAITILNKIKPVGIEGLRLVK
jgi:seryl-tRNA synthetase